MANAKIQNLPYAFIEVVIFSLKKTSLLASSLFVESSDLVMIHNLEGSLRNLPSASLHRRILKATFGDISLFNRIVGFK